MARRWHESRSLRVTLALGVILASVPTATGRCSSKIYWGQCGCCSDQPTRLPGTPANATAVAMIALCEPGRAKPLASKGLGCRACQARAAAEARRAGVANLKSVPKGITKTPCRKRGTDELQPTDSSCHCQSEPVTAWLSAKTVATAKPRPMDWMTGTSSLCGLGVSALRLVDYSFRSVTGVSSPPRHLLFGVWRL